MTNIIIKKNKSGPAPYLPPWRDGSGFVMLFAVTLSSILLAIALGVANIALKEVKFSTSARDTNDAFFAADTGVECALYYDLSPTKFPLAGPATAISCASATPTFSANGNTGLYSFTIIGLGSTGLGCAKVSVLKDGVANPATTTIVSKGYNIGDASCNSTNPNRVERELQVFY